ncbi:MAG: hypothetical protein HY699_06135 [Deltaproteobacteria bacterium]|nr:hypothetical protein [Deltaproteobacteria bacterium]
MLVRDILRKNNADATAKEDWAVLKELYAMLNILDGKAASLMTFDALILAVYAIVLQGDLGSQGSTSLQGVEGGPALYVSLIGMVVNLAATVVCAFVVRMSWAFLRDEVAVECKAVGRKVDQRTVCYQVAWWLSFVGVFVLVFAMLFRYTRIWSC